MARCSSDQCYSSASLCQTHKCSILDRMMPVGSSPAFVEESRAFYSGQILPGHAPWVGTMIRASPHHREVGNRMITSRRNISHLRQVDSAQMDTTSETCKPNSKSCSSIPNVKDGSAPPALLPTKYISFLDWFHFLYSNLLGR